MDAILYETMQRTCADLVCWELENAHIPHIVTGRSDIGTEFFAIPIRITVQRQDFERARNLLIKKGLVKSGEIKEKELSYNKYENRWAIFKVTMIPAMMFSFLFLSSQFSLFLISIFALLGLPLFIAYKNSLDSETLHESPEDDLDIDL